jgi:hypothetical protein
MLIGFPLSRLQLAARWLSWKAERLWLRSERIRQLQSLLLLLTKQTHWLLLAERTWELLLVEWVRWLLLAERTR